MYLKNLGETFVIYFHKDIKITQPFAIVVQYIKDYLAIMFMILKKKLVIQYKFSKEIKVFSRISTTYTPKEALSPCKDCINGGLCNVSATCRLINMKYRVYLYSKYRYVNVS